MSAAGCRICMYVKPITISIDIDEIWCHSEILQHICTLVRTCRTYLTNSLSDDRADAVCHEWHSDTEQFR